MPSGTLVRLVFQGDRLAAHRAHVEAHLAAQPLKGDAGLLIDENGQPHARLFDVCQRMIQRPRGAVGNAGDVFAHFARPRAGDEIGRAGGRIFAAQFGQFQNAVRAVAHADAAAGAGGEELLLVERPRRPDELGRQGVAPPGIEPQPQGEQRHTAGRAGHVGEKPPSADLFRCHLPETFFLPSVPRSSPLRART